MDKRDNTGFETGPFGEIFRQFVGRSNDAVTFLLALKSGETTGALHHNNIGDISIVYGNERGGLKKIADKHPDVLFHLQELLDEMTIIQNKSGNNRIRLESSTHYAVISIDYLGIPHSPWLLTAFEKKNSVLDNTMDTGETHKGERNDTATPLNTVSKYKDTTIFYSCKYAWIYSAKSL